MTITVITSSDRAFKQEYDDLSGPQICALIQNQYPDATIRYFLVPDEKHILHQTISQNLDSSWIFTTGGTGISQRDIVPETCAEICDRSIEGIANYLRMESLKETPFSVFSRAYAGQKDKCLIVNFPGSLKGAIFCTKLMLPLIPHGVSMVNGQGH